jgi:hypothetical protein
MEAFRLIADHGGIDLLFTDLGLPGSVSGRALADAARNVDPGMRVPFTTGYEPADLPDRAAALLRKPFNPAQLAEKVRGCAGGGTKDRTVGDGARLADQRYNFLGRAAQTDAAWRDDHRPLHQGLDAREWRRSGCHRIWRNRRDQDPRRACSCGGGSAAVSSPSGPATRAIPLGLAEFLVIRPPSARGRRPSAYRAPCGTCRSSGCGR